MSGTLVLDFEELVTEPGHEIPGGVDGTARGPPYGETDAEQDQAHEKGHVVFIHFASGHHHTHSQDESADDLPDQTVLVIAVLGHSAESRKHIQLILFKFHIFLLLVLAQQYIVVFVLVEVRVLVKPVIAQIYNTLA